MRQPLRPVAPLILLAMALSSCGQKGGLYIPQDANGEKAPAAATAAAPAAAPEAAQDAASESEQAAPAKQE